MAIRLNEDKYYKTKDPIKEEASHAEDHSDQL